MDDQSEPTATSQDEVNASTSNLSQEVTIEEMKASLANNSSSSSSPIEDDEIEEDDEAEPRLVYERIKNEISAIAQKDAISCFCVNSRLLVVGTHWGKIFVLDHLGNKVHRDIMLPTQSSVTQVSVDLKGEFIASCSGDKVYIHSLLTAENLLLNFDRPVRAVAIDPNFTCKNSDRRIITGEDKVVLHSRNFFSKYVRTILHQGDGMIRSIKWNGDLVAWSTDINVRIYDLSIKSLIAVIKRDHDIRLRPEVYKCCLTWKSSSTLLIGWADSVKVCEVRDKRNTLVQASSSSSSSSTVYNPDLPDKFVEVTSMFNINFCISGIVPLEHDQLILLVVDKDTSEASGSTPQMLVVQPLKSFDFIELSSDLLSPKGYQAYHCCDYHLEALIEDSIYFIVCPKDMIIAKPRSDDDHVAWLLERARYPEALTALSRSETVRKFTYVQVAKDYQDFLIERGSQSDLEKAASLTPSICGENIQQWDQIIKKFTAICQLPLLAAYVPISSTFKLQPSIYEAIIKSFIKQNPQGFLDVIKKWPSNLYDSKVIIHNVMDVLQFDSHNEILLRGLAIIYTNESKHDRALEIYLKIGDDTEVFDLIRRFDLYETLRNGLDVLMSLNPIESSRLLVDNQDKISTEFVVSKLQSKPSLLWVYLDQVIKRDPNSHGDYHQKLMELYAEHAPDRLLPFLKSSNLYSLEKALSICKSRKLVHEMVFLLARMGYRREALQSMMELDNIEAAIEFCKEHDDIELWNQMISLSKEKPIFMRTLLSNVGTHVPDPVSLIAQIPENIEIQGLKDALVNILEEYRILISLEERSKSILVYDNFSLFSKLICQRKKPFIVKDDSVCAACKRPILSSGLTSHGIRLFNCTHYFHQDCIQSASCALCTSADAEGLNFQ